MAIVIKALIFITGIFSVLGILAMRGSIYIWLLFISAIILTLQFIIKLGAIPSSLLWVLVLIGLFLSAKPIRQKLFSQQILNNLRKKRLLSDDPVITTIEKNLYTTDHLWFEVDLLNGNINWDKLLRDAEPELTVKEQSFLDNQVEELCRILKTNANDHDPVNLLNCNSFPPQGQIWEYLIAKSFLAILTPITYGGLGFSVVACAKIIQKVATCNITVAVTIMRFNSLNLSNLILKYGTTAQQETYLRSLSSGEQIATFVPASNIAENNVNLVDNNAVICYGQYDNQRILGVNLNWETSNVIFAPITTVLAVMLDLYDPHNLLEGSFLAEGSYCHNNKNYSSDKKILGMTVFIVPTNLVTIAKSSNNLVSNQTASIINGTIKGKDVFIPLDFIIGGKEMIGQGYRMIMDFLAIDQGIFWPALNSAISKACLKNTSAYAVVSKQLGLSTAQRAGIKTILSNISGYNYMLNAMYQLTLTSFHLGIYDNIVANIAKYHTTNISRKIINYSREINDNKVGVFSLLNNLMEAYQNIPNNLSIYGSNLFLKNFITIWQSVVKNHPFLAMEIMAVDNNDLAMFDQNFFAHLSYTLSGYAKTVLHVLSNKLFCKSPVIGNNKQLTKYCKEFSFLTKVLVNLIEIALWQYDFLLIQQNKVLARLEDVFSYIYIGCAVIKSNNNSKDLETWIYTKWCLQTCLYNIEQAILSFLQNLPNKLLANIVKTLIFGFSHRKKLPDDLIVNGVSSIITKKSMIRAKLLANCYVAENDVLEIAFQKILSAKAVWNKFYLAEKSGIIPKDLNLNLKINVGIQEKIVTELEGILVREAELAVKQIVTNN